MHPADPRDRPAHRARPVRPRRSSLAVRGSEPRMLEKGRSQPVDQVFLDLEDAVVPVGVPGVPWCRTRR
jgi:citrate lyase subunit beta / citryl-CoA lyase